jgi:hypothetical protein
MQPLLKRRLVEDFAAPEVAIKRAKTDTLLMKTDCAKYEQMRAIGRDIEQTVAEGKCANQQNRDVSW